ncbi:MAG: IS1182 family transposase [Actinopolymorphaceae bacterium]
MTLGLADRQGDLLDDINQFCDQALDENSVFAVLHRERDRMFGDEMFADLFSDRGRRSVPPSVVATVMVLQRLHGLSDREAVEHYTFDARWRYAAGVGGYESGGWGRFAHTVLVDMRARLAESDDPRRIFRVTVQAASQAGLVGAKRVLDSTPLYDAVATMDTVTLVRSAIRGLLKVCDLELEAELRAVLASGDDYASAAKPLIDWDDADAREQLIDARAKDGYAVLALLEGRVLPEMVSDAAQLLASVLGQDLDENAGGVFRIVRRVAKDRIISTVDPEARHGHKTSARGFDGYKGHVAADPDSEIITDTEVSAGNVGDAAVAADLIDDLLTDTDGEDEETVEAEPVDNAPDQPAVYGDAAYGAGEFLDRLDEAGIEPNCKTQPPAGNGELFSKDLFEVNLDEDIVTCPAGHEADIIRNGGGDGIASFGETCADCPMRAWCTNAAGGRTIRVGRYEQRLADARYRQRDTAWIADYRATRPKIERKIGHLMRRKHGGRRARVRGQRKVDADFNLLAAAHNLARLAVLGLHTTPGGWAAAPATS